MFKNGQDQGVFSDLWLVDEEIGEDLGEMANTIDRNKLGCQYPSCASGE